MEPWPSQQLPLASLHSTASHRVLYFLWLYCLILLASLLPLLHVTTPVRLSFVHSPRLNYYLPLGTPALSYMRACFSAHTIITSPPLKNPRWQTMFVSLTVSSSSPSHLFTFC
ncbi:hypothetical protein J4Q44_G00055300 [Coregonus suidteri]|uniref:Uncharacterized protein n=1 Tax=Coregonus suidteri TaxID=861788 RepID=A0AAN8NA91_9TELE